MIFEYRGVRYRIGFRHEPSRRWEDHYDHGVRLARRNENGWISGPAELWCMQCQIKLSHLSRAQRARNVQCTIWIQDGERPEPWSGDKLVPVWRLLAQGQGRLHPGDCYERERGRVAALRAALAHVPGLPEEWFEFRRALWHWFLHGRKQSAVERAAAKAAGRP